MAVEAHRTTFRWPDPSTLDPRELDPWYDSDIDLLELQFTPRPVPRVEVPLETPDLATPFASIRMDKNHALTGEVVGIMIQAMSEGYFAHPEWRELAEGRITPEVLRTLIETLAPLPPEEGALDPD